MKKFKSKITLIILLMFSFPNVLFSAAVDPVTQAEDDFTTIQRDATLQQNKPPFFLIYLDCMPVAEQVRNLLMSQNNGNHLAAQFAQALGISFSDTYPTTRLREGFDFNIVNPNIGNITTDYKAKNLAALIKEKASSHSVILISGGNNCSKGIDELLNDRTLSHAVLGFCAIHSIILFDPSIYDFNLGCVANRLYNFYSKVNKGMWRKVKPSVKVFDLDGCHLSAINVECHFNDTPVQFFNFNGRMSSTIESLSPTFVQTIFKQLPAAIDSFKATTINADFGCIFRENMSDSKLFIKHHWIYEQNSIKNLKEKLWAVQIPAESAYSVKRQLVHDVVRFTKPLLIKKAAEPKSELSPIIQEVVRADIAHILHYLDDAKYYKTRLWSDLCLKNYREYVPYGRVTPSMAFLTSDPYFTLPSSYVLSKEKFYEALQAFNSNSRELLGHLYAKPYAQKITAPSGSKAYFMGDVHGSIHSLVRYLYRLMAMHVIDVNFKIINPKTFLIFLGDIVDRGFYGAECFYTLLSLKLNNWNNVFILSGNHEIKEMWEGGGFRDELLVKFGEITPLINACFNVLPAALFIGSNNQWIQCCHGGVEPSFDTKQFLQGDSNFYDLSNLNRKRPAIQFMPDIPDIVKFEETLTRAINDISEVDVADADVFNLKQVLREFLRDRSEKKHANLEHAKNAILNDKLDEYPFFTAPEPGDVEPLKLALIAIKKRITSSILENFDNDFKFNPFSSGFNWCDFGDLHDGPFAMGYTLNRGYFCSGYTHENLKNALGVEAIFRGHEHSIFGFKIGGSMHWSDLIALDPVNAGGFLINGVKFTVFTCSTAAEGVALPFDCFVVLSINGEFKNWRLMPYEFALPGDRNNKKVKITKLPAQQVVPGGDVIQVQWIDTV